MKKLLGIVILSFLLTTNSYADLYDLKIDLEKPQNTNSLFLLKNGYSSKCQTSGIDLSASVTMGGNTDTADLSMRIDLNHFVEQNKILFGSPETIRIGLLFIN